MIFNTRRNNAWMLLLIAAAMLLAAIVPVEVEALRTRRLALLASVPRGGADAVPDAAGSEESSADSKGGVEEEDVEDEDDVEEEDETEVEENVESVVVEEIEEEVDELVEEVAEAIEVEAEVEESAAEDSEAENEDAAEAVEVEVEVEAAEVAADEEEVGVDYPTEEIISDDVRYFHTTDGELADDEGMYTDGQNESPIIAVGVTRGGDGDASDDNEDDGQQAEEEALSTEATAVRTAASVTGIDDDLKEVLMTDLRYTEEDVFMMRPEIAKEVVYNKLSRPTEGMPNNWYIDPEDAMAKPSMSLLSQLAKKKGLLVSVAAVGVAAVVLKDNDAIGDTVEDMVDAVKSIPKSLAAIVVAAKNTATRRPKPKPAEATPAALEATPEEEPQEEEEKEPETKNDMADFFSKGKKKRKPIKRHRTHSIKPGMTPKEVQDEAEADHTMLDKVLTGISKLVMKFFRIKI